MFSFVQLYFFRSSCQASKDFGYALPDSHFSILFFPLAIMQSK